MNLSATMDLKAGAFLGPLAGVRSGLAGVVGQIRNLAPLATGLGVLFGAFKSGEAVVENFFAAFEKGRELEKLHRITGQSVSDLFVLQKAFSAAGLDPGGLQHNLVLLQKSLGGVNEQGEPTKFIFDQLGLSIDSLQKMKAPAQLEAIGAKLRALPNPAQRSAAAMAIFGRAGAEMLAILDDPAALKDAMKNAAEIGALYERNAKIFSQISRDMAAIKGKVSSLFAGLAEGAAPAFKQILGWVKSIDLAKVGRDIGGIMRAIPAALEQGRFGELLNLTLSLGFAKAVNFFSASMRAALAELTLALKFIYSNFGSIADVLVSAAARFGVALLKAIEEPLVALQAGMMSFFDNDNRKLRRQAGMQAEAEVNKQFGVKSKNELVGAFGAFSRTPAQDRRLANYNDALERRTTQLEMSLGVKQTEDFKRELGGQLHLGFSGTGENLDQINARASAQGKAGMENLMKPMAEFFKNAATIARNFKIDDVVGAGAIGAQLKALVSKLTPEVNAAGEGKSGKDTLDILGGSQKPESDRLAKIGLFIGGGGPSLDYARRTANNTSRLVEQIKHLPVDIKNAIVSGSYNGDRSPLWVN